MLAEKVQSDLLTTLRTSVAATRRAAEDARRAVAADLVDAYNGTQYAMLDEDLQRIYKDSDVRELFLASAVFRNLVRLVISESSVALSRPPVIRIKRSGGTSSDEKLTEAFKVISGMVGLGPKLRELERFAYLTNDAALAVGARQVEYPADGKRALATWDIYDPSRYAVEQDILDPSRAKAFALTFMRAGSEGSNQGAPRFATITWTREAVTVTDEHGKDVTAEQLGQGPETVGINPYADLFDLPVVMFRSTTPQHGEFYGPNASDLLSQNRQLTIMETQLRLIEKLQGFGQLVLVNPPTEFKDQVPVGLLRALRVQTREGEPGDAKFINPGAPISELRANINHLIQQAAQGYGLNGVDLVASENKNTSYASGRAKAMDNLRLKAKTEEFQSLIEPRIAEAVKKTLLACRVWAQDGWEFPGIDSETLRGVPDYDDMEIEVRFASQPPSSSLDEFQLEQMQAKTGLLNWPERYMQSNPEIATVDEAEKKMIGNIERNQRVGEAAARAAAASMIFAAAGAGDAFAGKAVPGQPGRQPPPRPGMPAQMPPAAAGPGDPKAGQ